VTTTVPASVPAPDGRGGIADSRLRCRNLSLGYDGATVVERLDLDVLSGVVTVILGPNGSGKSTLLRGLARLLDPRHGVVLLDGRVIGDVDSREVACALSVLPQGPQAPDGLSVAELVSYGRYPHRKGALQTLGRADRLLIGDALRMTGLEDEAERPLSALSGGQRQRAWIAMAIAQDASILLLDEPTTFLDLSFQLEVLELLRRLNRDQGRTVVMVMHDINHAARYGDHLIAMAGGTIVAQGRPEEVVTRGVLRNVFGVEAELLRDPRTGSVVCVAYAATPGSDRRRTIQAALPWGAWGEPSSANLALESTPSSST